ncbi:5356_t:CDS:2 [Acaulospora colombiana]|uniref:5356_t:CDS:1 n=1 Tax=Acaulospora colombiana TaxID=27376 RepID=A0ACA9LV61_9GLOM|nr:5356_t:CDS:2 [Acaulospora colombiana]
MAYTAVPESMKNIKALLYSVFGTIVDWRTTVAQELASFATLTSTRCSINTQISSKNWHEFARKWRSGCSDSVEKSLSTRHPFLTLDEIHRGVLATLIKEFEIPQHVWSEDEMEQVNTVWHRLDCFEDGIPGLTRLSKKYINATLSNANVKLLVDLKRHAGLHMLDYMFSAELFKEYKPKDVTYLGACEMLALDPDEVVMVSSDQNDLVNAKKLGLRTVYVRRKDEVDYHREVGGNEEPVGEDEFDWVVESLEELADVMGC